MTCDFVGRGGEWKDLGVGGEGEGDILVIKTKKNGWEDLGFRRWRGPCF